MTGFRFDDRLLDEIRARVTLSDLVGRRVRLKKAGREFCGLSPFTPERSPSFFVNDQKRFWHCFSSGRHGDVFRWLMDQEGLSFPEAVAEAADLAGVDLPARPAKRERRFVPPAELMEIRRAKGIVGPAAALGLVFRPLGGRLVGACPVCGGGATAARCELKPERAGWVCAACQGGGDAIGLARSVRGWGFAEALDWLKGLPDAPADEGVDDGRSAEFRQRERVRLYRTWRKAAAAEGSPVEAYFALRGLILPPPRALRFVAEMPYFHGLEPDPQAPADAPGRKRPRAIHVGPAMVAAMTGPDGRFRGLHVTWIDLDRPKGKAQVADPDTGEILPAKKMRGSSKGAHIDLAGPRDARRMIAGEGVETVAAVRTAMIVTGRAVDEILWRVAGSTGNLGGKATETVRHPTLKTAAGRTMRVPGPYPDMDDAAMSVPDTVDDLTLLGDGDSDPFTTRAVVDRGCRRHARPGRLCRQAWPPGGLDFDDMARRARATGGER